MFLFNALLFAVSFAGLRKGEEKWFTFSLADSYERQILNGEGALNLSEYREKIREEGLTIHHLEVQRKIIVLEDEEALKGWIREEIAPFMGIENDELFVEIYFTRMKEIGWAQLENGRIWFPREKLVVLLSRE